MGVATDSASTSLFRGQIDKESESLLLNEVRELKDVSEPRSRK